MASGLWRDLVSVRGKTTAMSWLDDMEAADPAYPGPNAGSERVWSVRPAKRALAAERVTARRVSAPIPRRGKRKNLDSSGRCLDLGRSRFVCGATESRPACSGRGSPHLGVAGGVSLGIVVRARRSASVTPRSGCLPDRQAGLAGAGQCRQPHLPKRLCSLRGQSDVRLAIRRSATGARSAGGGVVGLGHLRRLGTHAVVAGDQVWLGWAGD